MEVRADYRQLPGTGADLSGCGWPPLGKLGLRSGASDLLQALACLADELQAVRGPMWGLASTNMFPSTQKDRANVLESKPRRPLDSHPHPLPPSFKTLSISPDSAALPLLRLLHIRASLSAATSLSLAHISGSFSIFPSSRLSLIPLCCCFPVLQSFFLT